MASKKLENPIIFVPGLGDTSQTPWWWLVERHFRKNLPNADLHWADFSMKIKWPLASDKFLGIPATSIGDIKKYAEQLKSKIEEISSDGVNLLAHSMGGMISRWCIEKLDGDKLVENLVTLGTPHQGLHLLRFFKFIKACRQMVPGSGFIKELNSDPLPENVDYNAFWGGKDWFYSRKENAKLPEDLVSDSDSARNIYAEEYGHIGLLARKNLFDKYFRCLD